MECHGPLPVWPASKAGYNYLLEPRPARPRPQAIYLTSLLQTWKAPGRDPGQKGPHLGRAWTGVARTLKGAGHNGCPARCGPRGEVITICWNLGRPRKPSYAALCRSPQASPKCTLVDLLGLFFRSPRPLGRSTSVTNPISPSESGRACTTERESLDTNTKSRA
jgi:hypothetical protein